MPEHGLRALTLPVYYPRPPRLHRVVQFHLDFQFAAVGDVSWIENCQFDYVDLSFSAVTNLAGLAGSNVDVLSLGSSSIKELASLIGCRVRILQIDDTEVRDLIPLAQTGVEILVVSSDMPATSLQELQTLMPDLVVQIVESLSDLDP